MEHDNNCVCHLCLEPAPIPTKTKYRVHGYCLMPAEAEIEVEAGSAEEALQNAMAAWGTNKRALIDRNSVDEGAAFDWQPTAELLTPNTKVQP